MESLPVTHPHVVDCFLQDSYYLEKWKEFSDQIGIGMRDLMGAAIRFATGVSGKYEITHALLQQWVKAKGAEATLEKLIEILKSEPGYKELCGTLEELLKDPKTLPNFKSSSKKIQDALNSPSMDLRYLQVEHRLDCDTYSDTYKVRCLFDKKLFILKRISVGRYKQMMKKPEALRFFLRLMRQVRVMVQLDQHKNIASYQDGWFEGPLTDTFMNWIKDQNSTPEEISQAAEREPTEAEMNTYLFIKMEYMEINLARYVHSRPKDITKEEITSTTTHIVKEILTGLNFIHGKGFFHRDLHPGNILLNLSDEGSIESVKIGDFGLSRDLPQQDTSLTISIGGNSFTSPEMDRGDKYDNKTDIFSVAVIWIFMIHQFATLQEFERMIERIRMGDLGIIAQLGNVGKSEARLLNKMLERRPGNRPKADEALMELK